MAKAIAITSGKGGVGKSSVCVNMGMVLAQKGYRVCLIDVDLGLKNLDIMLGLENRILYDLRDVMMGNCSLGKVIIQDKRESNLYLFPACKSVQISEFKKNDLQLVMDELKKSFDYLLLDAPAGIESGFRHAISCADEAIVVTTLDVTSIQDADRIVGILMKEQLDNISLVVNRVNKKYIEKGISTTLEDALSCLCIPLLGVVYEEAEMIKSNNRGIPITLQKNSFIASCFDIIVERLLGKEVSIPKIKEKSIFQRIFG